MCFNEGEIVLQEKNPATQIPVWAPVLAHWCTCTCTIMHSNFSEGIIMCVLSRRVPNLHVCVNFAVKSASIMTYSGHKAGPYNNFW